MNSFSTAIIGASKGLGREILKMALEKEQSCLAVSRTIPVGFADQVSFLSLDMSKKESVLELMETLKQNKLQRVFYVAGGGPYGNFGSKQWKDHLWSFQVNLLTPLELLHSACKDKWCNEFYFVGSAIAESTPDPRASAYSSSKHGLKGALSSMIAEGQVDPKIYLISPGYMDTSLLPKGAEVRQNGSVISNPQDVAKKIWRWVESPDRHWHLEL